MYAVIVKPKANNNAMQCNRLTIDIKLAKEKCLLAASPPEAEQGMHKATIAVIWQGCTPASQLWNKWNSSSSRTVKLSRAAGISNLSRSWRR
jgi:hypothetical protein